MFSSFVHLIILGGTRGKVEWSFENIIEKLLGTGDEEANKLSMYICVS